MNRNTRIKGVCINVAAKVSDRTWIRLEGDGVSPARTRSEDGVLSDIRPDIDELIIGAKKMENKRHIDVLVQAAIKVSGRPRHSPSDNQGRAFNPRMTMLCNDAASDLSAEVLSQRFDWASLVERVLKNESKS